MAIFFNSLRNTGFCSFAMYRRSTLAPSDLLTSALWRWETEQRRPAEKYVKQIEGVMAAAPWDQ